MDADNGRIIGEPFPIGGLVDSNIFDPETGLAACSTGDGKIHIFHFSTKMRPINSAWSVFFSGWPLLLFPMHIVFLEPIIDLSCSLIFEAEPAEENLVGASAAEC